MENRLLNTLWVIKDENAAEDKTLLKPLFDLFQVLNKGGDWINFRGSDCHQEGNVDQGPRIYTISNKYYDAKVNVDIIRHSTGVQHTKVPEALILIVSWSSKACGMDSLQDIFSSWARDPEDEDQFPAIRLVLAVPDTNEHVICEQDDFETFCLERRFDCVFLEVSQIDEQIVYIRTVLESHSWSIVDAKPNPYHTPSQARYPNGVDSALIGLDNTSSDDSDRGSQEHAL